VAGVVVFAVLLFVGIGFLALPHSSNDPLLRLKIVRQTVDQGKPVVFFRVERPGRKRIRIKQVDKIIGDRMEGFDPRTSTKDFFAPSQESPVDNPMKSRKDLGVLAPTNASVWKLRVLVQKEEPNPLKRVPTMVRVWKFRHRYNLHGSVLDYWTGFWNGFTAGPSQWIESDFITNSVSFP